MRKKLEKNRVLWHTEKKGKKVTALSEQAEKVYCQWCGCELTDENWVVIGDDKATGRGICLCDSCATSIFLSNDADMLG